MGSSQAVGSLQKMPMACPPLAMTSSTTRACSAIEDGVIEHLGYPGNGQFLRRFSGDFFGGRFFRGLFGRRHRCRGG
jgi:hypothetical protein